MVKDGDRRVYARIADDLTRQIRDGQLKPGTLLPGRRELSRQYGVALGTTQQAIGLLVAAGLLVADNRRGTYVSGAQATRREPAATGTGALRRPLAHSTVGILATVNVPEASGEAQTGSKLSIRGLEEVLSQHKIATAFSNLWFAPDAAAALEQKTRLTLESGADALAFVFPANSPEITSVAARLAEASPVPALVVATDLMESPIPQIYSDQVASGYLAATHLLEKGFDRIVFLAPYAARWVDERIARIRKACANAGLGDDAVRVVWPDEVVDAWTMGEGRAMHCQACVAAALDGEFLQGVGVIAADDFVAVALVEECRKRGIVASENFSLVSFDDAPNARELGISSVRPPFEAMGAECGRLLVRLMQGETVNAQIRLSSQLMIRNSSRFGRQDLSLAPAGHRGGT